MVAAEPVRSLVTLPEELISVASQRPAHMTCYRGVVMVDYKQLQCADNRALPSVK